MADPASQFGAVLPSLVGPPPGSHSRALAERLRSVESRNVTYLSEDFPVFWEEAKGANVRDVDGNVYVDFTAAFGVSFAGHAHPRIERALVEQSERLIHGMGDVHPPALKLELLERLSTLAPWDDTRSVLGSSGSEAMEAALKTAELSTGRSGVIAFEGGYHGLTLGSLAVTARPDFREPFRARVHQGVAFAPFPRTEAESEVALAEVQRLLSGGIPGVGSGSQKAVGAVVIEPVQGRAGVRIPPPGFLARLAELTRAEGSLLIFDEIFTGLGRTGVIFEYEREGVLPDLVCLGKALGGGLPLSACLGSREVMDAWPESGGEALHTSTFLGHPLACATALAFLAVLEEEKLVARSLHLGERIVGRLRQGLEPLAGVREVRGRGLLIGIELASDAGGPAAGLGARVAEAALRRGLLVLPAGGQGEVVELAPPAVTSDAQIDFGIDCLVEAINESLNQ
ncbi:MAG: aspartate aminotransferase family protein [Gemmatimonadetes bacterium]|nr:aspartate aminotransferase family protein [Gemmatimonadota bacterium]